jgi:DNA-binding phage protein
LDTSNRWPESTFRDVEDEAIREACMVAQEIANAVLEGMGKRSESELAAQAGVDRKMLRKLLAGETWPAIYTVTRLFQVVGREIRVPRPPDPRELG